MFQIFVPIIILEVQRCRVLALVSAVLINNRALFSLELKMLNFFWLSSKYKGVSHWTNTRLYRHGKNVHPFNPKP